MGLKEKQAIAGLDLDFHVKRIKKDAGVDVTFEVDQDGFGSDIDAVYFAENRGAQVVADAFSYICTDQIGKEAIQSLKLSKIVLKHVPNGKRELDIKDGVMKLIHDFNAGSSSDRWDGGSLQKELENRL